MMIFLFIFFLGVIQGPVLLVHLNDNKVMFLVFSYDCKAKFLVFSYDMHFHLLQAPIKILRAKLQGEIKI